MQTPTAFATFPMAFRLGRDPESFNTQLKYAQSRYEKVETEAKDAQVAIEQHMGAALLKLSDDFAIVPEMTIDEWTTLAKIPGTSRNIPDSLWNTKAGMHYRKKLAKNALGMHLAGGSASDKMFSGPDVMLMETLLYYNVGGSLQRHFMAFLDFSNNRPLLISIPVPGFSYAFNISPLWGTALGFPNFSMWIEPFDGVHYQVNVATLLFSAETKLDIDINEIFKLFFAYQNGVNTYMRADRVDTAERIFTQISDLSGGLEFNLASKIILDLSAGYSFGKSIFEVKNFIDRGSAPLRVANGFMGRFGLQASF